MFRGFESPSPLLPEIFALHGKWQVGKPALIAGELRQTWPALMCSTHRFANALINSGVRLGDSIGIVMSNGAEMVHALLGCMSAGAVSVPINLSVSDESLVNMLVDAQIAGLVVTGDQFDRLASLQNRLPPSVKVQVTTGATHAKGWHQWSTYLAGADDAAPNVHIDGDSVLNVIYSSGTTGIPKGIVHTHRGRRDWAYDLAIALRYHGAAKSLFTIGLYSNISWVSMLATLLAGGTLVVHDKFDETAFLDTVEREDISHAAMVPIQFQRVTELQLTQPRNVSSMTAMMSAGSPLREPLKRRIFEAFPCGIIELYGLTEGIITTLDPEDAQGRWSSVGRPLIGTDIAIIDDEGQMVPAGVSGEIVSRGRITMPGYLNRADASQESEYIDMNGQQWLRSGDIGQFDEEGFLYIVDRKKDMILSGGQNIYPQDIEAVVALHDMIYDVAVIGAPSERWGETPIALVVPKPGVTVCDDCRSAIRAFANEQLGKQQRIADVVVVDELPRNPNGKILKRELREQFKHLQY
ncbi:MAG: class I adenylate-forming enzyme family protein [Halieaceae bacterium]|nr:class I adenylate-forming enzyme family protein [Halieaceae bacterium]